MSSIATPLAMASTHCALLELPAELRNVIFELSFTSDVAENTTVDISCAPTPSTALLITCKQIRSEATGLHAQASKDFWVKSIFHTNFTAHFKLDDIMSLRDSDVALVKNLTLDFHTTGSLTRPAKFCHATLLFDGTWKLESPGSPPKLAVVSKKGDHHYHLTRQRIAKGDLQQQVDEIRTDPHSGPWNGTLKKSIQVLLNCKRVYYPYT